jgi:hypothetical protein
MMMSRKDTAQEVDRPHYYSQFWIDVAQGKRDLSAVRSVESDAEIEDMELTSRATEPEPAAGSAPKPKAAKLPDKKVEPVRPVISSLADLANIDLLMKSSAEMDNDEVPDIEAGAIDDLGPFGQAGTEAEPSIVTDFDLENIEDEPEEVFEDSVAESEDFDEDEDDEWGSTRKPSKPQKPRRQPRERRGY